MARTVLRALPIHELERYMRCKDCSEVHASSDHSPDQANFQNQFNAFCSPGKSLPISRNRVKPWNQKYSSFVLTQITAISPPSHPLNEGRIMIVTDVGMGCGGRESCERRTQLSAYGEDVWS
jgi:hypothetical protein